MKKLKESKVVFNKETHEYLLNGKKLKGVTPIVAWVYPDTYKNIPESVLMKAAEYGSMVHSKCELADRVGIADCEPVRDYLRIKEELGLVTVENEYLVSDNENIASSIDVVLKDLNSEEGNTMDLADIKTTSSLHFECVRLQLSIYAYLFEKDNPGMKAGKLYAFWLPKPQYGKSRYYELKRISSGLIEKILEAYINGESNMLFAEMIESEVGENKASEKKEGELMSDEEVEELIRIKKAIADLKEKEAGINRDLMERLKASGEKKWGNDLVTVTLKAAGTRVTVDSKALKENYPEVYSECSKVSETAESIMVKVL